MIYEGGSRTQAAAVGGVALQVVRDWALRFNGHGPEGLIDRKAPGQPSLLNDEHRAALAMMVEISRIPAVHGVNHWRIIDLCQWDPGGIRDQRIEADAQSRPGATGYRKLSARPRHHAQKAGAVKAFKKVWPTPSARVISNGVLVRITADGMAASAAFLELASCSLTGSVEVKRACEACLLPARYVSNSRIA
jgi:hypothetical protein